MKVVRYQRDSRNLRGSSFGRRLPFSATEDITPMTNAAISITCRALLGSGIAAMAVSSLSLPTNAQEITMAATEPFWPNNARLAVSFSLMFEAGGQPISGAGGVIPDPIEKGLPDLPTNAFFQ